MDTERNGLRVLHVILALTPTNGQYSEHCLPLRRVRDITICTYFSSDIQPPNEVRLYDGNGSVRGFHNALRSALEDREYDVLHVHTPHAGVLLLMTLLRRRLYRKLKPKLVHTVQNSFPSFTVRHKLMFVPSFLFFQRLVFCSEASRDSFPRLYRWMAGKRTRVAQNAVDLSRLDAVEHGLASVENGFNIVSVGLYPIKNSLTVLEAFRRSGLETNADSAPAASSDAHIAFMGEGELRSQVAYRADEASLNSQVVTTGMIQRDEVFEHFHRADLFVSASYGEGLPVAVMEAMACRCPVVLSDIPPHREIAGDADFIALLDPDDVEGFAREISHFRSMRPAERQAIGDRCRQIIEDKFSLATMHGAYADVYSEITGTHVALPV